ncbi:MAG: hypothetical protein MJZ91_01355 [Bacteroidales bacterium]|nr:hypothetical protein [Bacteroidales bacterium]
MKKLTLICMAIIATMFFGSCRGPMGPEGPVGPQGNANVASSTLTVRSNDWTWDNTSWRVDIDYAAINMDIHNYGAVLVYMSEGNTWRQLPMTFYYSQFGDDNVEYFYSSSLEVSSYQGGVSIFWTENDFYDGYRPDDHQFKIVVIAANLYNSRQDIDYSNYEAVKKAFQLAD